MKAEDEFARRLCLMPQYSPFVILHLLLAPPHNVGSESESMQDHENDIGGWSWSDVKVKNPTIHR
jgi:hypothetical protein